MNPNLDIDLASLNIETPTEYVLERISWEVSEMIFDTTKIEGCPEWIEKAGSSFWRSPPAYAENRSCVFNIVDAMSARGWGFTMSKVAGDGEAIVDFKKGDEVVFYSSPCVAYATCIAALKALKILS